MVESTFLSPILYPLALTMIMVPLSALLLWATTIIFNIPNRSFSSAFIISLIVAIAQIILTVGSIVLTTSLGAPVWITWVVSISSFLFVSIVLSWHLVKSKYQLEMGKSWLIWLVWKVFTYIVRFVVNIVLLGIFLAVGYAMGSTLV